MTFLTVDSIWRDSITPGIPSSGAHEPNKAEIRRYHKIQEGVSANGVVFVETLAELNAITDRPEFTGGLVASGDDSGTYSFIGGAWVKIRELDGTLTKISQTNDDVNDIIATPQGGLGTLGAIAFLWIPSANNTGPMTLNLGDGALPFMSFSGVEAPADMVVAGRPYLFVLNGSEWLVTAGLTEDTAQAQAAAAQAAISAQDAAASSGALTLAALAMISPSVKTVFVYGEGPRNGQFLWDASDQSANVFIDPLQGVFVPPTSDLTGASGAWVRHVEADQDGLNLDWFGVDKTGGQDASPAVSSALSLASVLGFPKVYGIGSGTLVCNEPFIIPENITIQGNKSLVLKRAANRPWFSFLTLKDKSQVIDWVIDGSWDFGVTSQTGLANCLIDFEASVGAIAAGNTIINSGGCGIISNTAHTSIIEFNKISVFHDHGVFSVNLPFSDATSRICNNEITGIGWSGILVQSADNALISDNEIIGTLIGGRNGRLVVNTSGNTVTHVSGPDFTTLHSGMFFVADNGREFRIASVDSATQLTVDNDAAGNPPGTLTGITVGCGTGDLIGVISSSRCVIRNNQASNSSTFGMGISLGGVGSPQASDVIFSGNSVVNAGKTGISVSGVALGGLIENFIVTGNTITNAGYGGGIGPSERTAIFVDFGTPARITNGFIGSNTVRSFAGEGQTLNWLGFGGQSLNGSISISEQSLSGLNSDSVANDIRDISLSGGWGVGAFVVEQSSNGRDAFILIEAGSSGVAFGASFTVLKVATRGASPVLPTIFVTSSTTGAIDTFFGQQNSTQGSLVGFLNGTPAAGARYAIAIKE